MPNSTCPIGDFYSDFPGTNVDGMRRACWSRVTLPWYKETILRAFTARIIHTSGAMNIPHYKGGDCHD